jgi:prevent-host-death family protein
MATVGVRELKDHLTSYLRRTQAGESMVITDRGRAVAVLGPVPE